MEGTGAPAAFLAFAVVCDAANRTMPVESSIPAADASTRPSLSPATSSGSLARSARTIGTGSLTGKSAIAGGSGAPGGLARLISSTNGMAGVSATGGPKAFGAPRPGRALRGPLPPTSRSAAGCGSARTAGRCATRRRRRPSAGRARAAPPARRRLPAAGGRWHARALPTAGCPPGSVRARRTGGPSARAAAGRASRPSGSRRSRRPAVRGHGSAIRRSAARRSVTRRPGSGSSAASRAGAGSGSTNCPRHSGSMSTAIRTRTATNAPTGTQRPGANRAAHRLTGRHEPSPGQVEERLHAAGQQDAEPESHQRDRARGASAARARRSSRSANALNNAPAGEGLLYG